MHTITCNIDIIYFKKFKQINKSLKYDFDNYLSYLGIVSKLVLKI